MGILAGIFIAAFLQDLSFTAKTLLVSRGHRTLAVAADVCAMLTSSLYLILTASVTMQSGLSFVTAEAFAAIATGGACGTIVGMFAVERLELRLTRKRPLSEGITDQRQDGRLAVTSSKTGGDGLDSNAPRTPQQRPANGFEDPWGRVEFATGPKGPLTQRSTNRLGVRWIVFQRTLPILRGDKASSTSTRCPNIVRPGFRGV